MAVHDEPAQGENNGNNGSHAVGVARDNTPSNLLQWVMEIKSKIRLQGQRIFDFVMIDLNGHEALNEVNQWRASNPKLFYGILALVIVLMLPAIVLLSFGILTMLLTLAGFLILEGTLLTGLLIVLVSCLGSLALFVLFLVTFVAATYYGVRSVANIYENSQNLHQPR